MVFRFGSPIVIDPRHPERRSAAAASGHTSPSSHSLSPLQQPHTAGVTNNNSSSFNINASASITNNSNSLSSTPQSKSNFNIQQQQQQYQNNSIMNVATTTTNNSNNNNNNNHQQQLAEENEALLEIPAHVDSKLLPTGTSTPSTESEIVSLKPFLKYRLLVPLLILVFVVLSSISLSIVRVVTVTNDIREKMIDEVLANHLVTSTSNNQVVLEKLESVANSTVSATMNVLKQHTELWFDLLLQNRTRDAHQHFCLAAFEEYSKTASSQTIPTVTVANFATQFLWRSDPDIFDDEENNDNQQNQEDYLSVFCVRQTSVFTDACDLVSVADGCVTGRSLPLSLGFIRSSNSSSSSSSSGGKTLIAFVEFAGSGSSSEITMSTFSSSSSSSSSNSNSEEDYPVYEWNRDSATILSDSLASNDQQNSYYHPLAEFFDSSTSTSSSPPSLKTTSLHSLYSESSTSCSWPSSDATSISSAALKVEFVTRHNSQFNTENNNNNNNNNEEVYADVIFNESTKIRTISRCKTSDVLKKIVSTISDRMILSSSSSSSSSSIFVGMNLTTNTFNTKQNVIVSSSSSSSASSSSKTISTSWESVPTSTTLAMNSINNGLGSLYNFISSSSQNNNIDLSSPIVSLVDHCFSSSSSSFSGIPTSTSLNFLINSLPPLTCGIIFGYDSFVANSESILQQDVDDAATTRLIHVAYFPAIIMLLIIITTIVSISYILQYSQLLSNALQTVSHVVDAAGILDTKEFIFFQEEEELEEMNQINNTNNDDEEEDEEEKSCCKKICCCCCDDDNSNQEENDDEEECQTPLATIPGQKSKNKNKNNNNENEKDFVVTLTPPKTLNPLSIEASSASVKKKENIENNNTSTTATTNSSPKFASESLFFDDNNDDGEKSLNFLKRHASSSVKRQATTSKNNKNKTILQKQKPGAIKFDYFSNILQVRSLQEKLNKLCNAAVESKTVIPSAAFDLFKNQIESQERQLQLQKEMMQQQQFQLQQLQQHQRTTSGSGVGTPSSLSGQNTVNLNASTSGHGSTSNSGQASGSVSFPGSFGSQPAGSLNLSLVPILSSSNVGTPVTSNLKITTTFGSQEQLPQMADASQTSSPLQQHQHQAQFGMMGGENSITSLPKSLRESAAASLSEYPSLLQGVGKKIISPNTSLTEYPPQIISSSPGNESLLAAGSFGVSFGNNSSIGNNNSILSQQQNAAPTLLQTSTALMNCPLQPRKATILCCSIVGLIQLVEEENVHDAKALSQLFLNVVSKYVTEHGGTMHRVNADSVIAVWGAIRYIPDGELKATLCAVDIHETLQSLQQKLNFYFDYTCVVVSGPLVSGFAGTVSEKASVLYGQILDVVEDLPSLMAALQVRVGISQDIRDRILGERKWYSFPIDNLQLPPDESPGVNSNGMPISMKFYELRLGFAPEYLRDAELAFAKLLLGQVDDAVETLQQVVEKILNGEVGEDVNDDEQLTRLYKLAVFSQYYGFTYGRPQPGWPKNVAENYIEDMQKKQQEQQQEKIKREQKLQLQQQEKQQQEKSLSSNSHTSYDNSSSNLGAPRERNRKVSIETDIGRDQDQDQDDHDESSRNDDETDQEEVAGMFFNQASNAAFGSGNSPENSGEEFSSGKLDYHQQSNNTQHSDNNEEITATTTTATTTDDQYDPFSNSKNRVDFLAQSLSMSVSTRRYHRANERRRSTHIEDSLRQSLLQFSQGRVPSRMGGLSPAPPSSSGAVLSGGGGNSNPNSAGNSWNPMNLNRPASVASNFGGGGGSGNENLKSSGRLSSLAAPQYLGASGIGGGGSSRPCSSLSVHTPNVLSRKNSMIIGLGQVPGVGGGPSSQSNLGVGGVPSSTRRRSVNFAVDDITTSSTANSSFSQQQQKDPNSASSSQLMSTSQIERFAKMAASSGSGNSSVHSSPSFSGGGSPPQHFQQHQHSSQLPEIKLDSPANSITTPPLIAINRSTPEHHDHQQLHKIALPPSIQITSPNTAAIEANKKKKQQQQQEEEESSPSPIKVTPLDTTSLIKRRTSSSAMTTQQYQQQQQQQDISPTSNTSTTTDPMLGATNLSMAIPTISTTKETSSKQQQQQLSPSPVRKSTSTTFLSPSPANPRNLSNARSPSSSSANQRSPSKSFTIKDRKGISFRVSEACLGKGAFGEVYMGLTETGCPVAVKMVNVPGVDDANKAAKLQQQQEKEQNSKSPSASASSQNLSPSAQQQEIEEKTPKKLTGVAARRAKRKGQPVSSTAKIEDVRNDIEQVLIEVSVLSRLRHENIVGYMSSAVCRVVDKDAITAVGSPPVTRTKLALVMEYIPGGSLAGLLQKLARTSTATSVTTPSSASTTSSSTSSGYQGINEQTAVHYLRDILLGLKFLHEEGFIHRDLKPGNVLLLSDGSCKLTDFGTTVSIGKLTGKTDMMGTPQYMAPEACRSEKPTAKTDVWAFGIMMAEILTGTVPWPPEEGVPFSPVRFIYQVGKVDTMIPKVQSSSSSSSSQQGNNAKNNKNNDACVVPPEAERIIMKCCQRDQDLRPTVDEILEMNYFRRVDARLSRGLSAANANNDDNNNNINTGNRSPMNFNSNSSNNTGTGAEGNFPSLSMLQHPTTPSANAAARSPGRIMLSSHSHHQHQHHQSTLRSPIMMTPSHSSRENLFDTKRERNSIIQQQQNTNNPNTSTIPSTNASGTTTPRRSNSLRSPIGTASSKNPTQFSNYNSNSSQQPMIPPILMTAQLSPNKTASSSNNNKNSDSTTTPITNNTGESPYRPDTNNSGGSNSTELRNGSFDFDVNMMRAGDSTHLRQQGGEQLASTPPTAASINGGRNNSNESLSGGGFQERNPSAGAIPLIEFES